MQQSANRRVDSSWRTKRHFRKVEADEDQLARFKAAFVEADTEKSNFVNISQLGSLFHKLGYFDLKAEEIEKLAREHAANATQNELNFAEFSSMMATYEEKMRFFSTLRLSSEEWVLASLRTMSQHFRKESFSNGEVVWSRSNAEAAGQIILIMKGMGTMQGKMGKVELPICAIGPGTLIGSGYLPALASRVVASGEVDTLACRPEDLRQRIGEQFMQELASNLTGQEALFKTRVEAFRELFQKSDKNKGIRLPFKVTKKTPKGPGSTLAGLGAQVQQEAKLPPRSHSAMELRHLSPLSTQARTPVRSSLSIKDFVAVADPSPNPNRQVRRPLRQSPEADKNPKLQASRIPVNLHARTYKPFNHRTPQSNIPRQVPKAEYHVCIDTNTMLYDDLT